MFVSVLIRVFSLILITPTNDRFTDFIFYSLPFFVLFYLFLFNLLLYLFLPPMSNQVILDPCVHNK